MLVPILRIRGEDGQMHSIPAIKGDPGRDGTIHFEDLTQAQKDSLKGDPGPQGPQGEPGQTGPAGPAGEKGDPYTLTEEDAQIIVQAVLAALPNGDEVSY